MKKPFTDHPDFMQASFVASEVIMDAMTEFGCSKVPEKTAAFDIRLNTIADDLTRALLAMRDYNKRKAA